MTDNKKNLVSLSRFLSYVLRHGPESIHLSMDAKGWVDIQELIKNALTYRGIRLDEETIKTIVATNDKQRYVISEDGDKIRANQGHSIDVDLDLKPRVPPDLLYHGTATRFLDVIKREGLKPLGRQFVHLSGTAEIAAAVGQRHGKPVVLTIDAKKMHEEGFEFYLSENQVWLTKTVPAQFIGRR